MALTPYDKEYWDCKEQFLNTFKPLVDEFYEIQLANFSRPTAQNYALVAGAWINFIHDYTDCLNYKEISVSETNSKFFASAKYEGLYGFDSREVKNKLKVFIAFLKERGYENSNVDKALAKK